MGGVKIVKARRQEGIHPFLGLIIVYLAVYHRQTHAAEAEVLFDFGKISCHKEYLLCFLLLYHAVVATGQALFKFKIELFLDILLHSRYTNIVQKRTIYVG